ncbi:hypothetical protein AB0F25_18675 [Streptomyces wedmorensis]|uniref:hypothetical protein n=1 Tax=Streptomyces wedmorensis TaxID=43759 RepID=UPI00343BEDD9
MPVRRSRHAVAALVVAGSIGLATVGCSGADEPSASAAAAVTAAPAEHTDVLSALPATVDGTKIVVVGGSAEFSRALRDAGV